MRVIYNNTSTFESESVNIDMKGAVGYEKENTAYVAVK